ncbi:highly divergent homeobox isoform X2 [Xenopus laevis]|uniref:Highly divergent homeobox isoform X2 n=1 Tax=Xenopus laevis TaxID=8355 RepID=A0A8J1LQB9_XENLA|nr:highly divergent homeobox isoform X2 [Xenopus laevis]
MEGPVAPNVEEVTSTGSQGYQPEMNLRSVFTTEQQRILQRYYENGMTNQSKSCFQLILQCAQETKLDFSVVRTWVGNKRRKMSSSKNYKDSEIALPGSVSNSPSRPPEVCVRNVPNNTRTQPSQTSSNSDLIMNCVYSPNNSLVRQGSTPPITASKTETLKPNLSRPGGRNEGEYLKMQVPVQRQAPLSKSSLQQLDEKSVMLSRQPSLANPPNSLYAKKNFSVSTVQVLERIAPQKTMTWSIKSVADPPGGQRLYKSDRPSISPIGNASMGQRNRESSCGIRNLEIREVFSLATKEHSSRALGGTVEDRPRLVESNCFSIAMETGDVDDEYAREEELASMAAQNQACLRYRENNCSPNLDNHCALSPMPVRTGTCKTMAPNSRDLSEGLMFQNRDYYLSQNTSTHNTTSPQYPGGNTSRNSMHPPYTASPQQRLPQNQNNYPISGNLTVPWIMECSRKRTLQDRTQFSDHDLATLKKYWDNGMTSLGSVCREKIEAVASELNVDCEIVRTWIGNRRRKYRLMGIEVPPPRGGPATFSESGSSLLPSVDDPVAEVAEDNDRNDDASICLSEESSQDEMPEVVLNEDIAIKEDCHDSVPVHNVKVEVVEEEITDAMSKFDVEQMRCLLDYKNEEMRYMENELENYKQKYAELQAFIKNLVQAVKSNDKDQQQILLSESPLELEDMDYSHPSPEPEYTSYSMSSVSEKNTPDSL